MDLRPVNSEAADAQALITRQLSTHGAVLLENFTTEQFQRAMRKIGRVYPHPQADQTGTTTIQPGACHQSERGFSRTFLHAHTDRAQIREPPGLLGLLCVTSAADGGQVALADFAEVILRLKSQGFSAAFLQANLWLRIGTGHVRLPMLWADHAGGLCVRYRDDHVARPDSDHPTLLERLSEAIESSQQVIRLNTGDGYIVSNHRWLHGRREFSGDRLALRVLLIESFNASIATEIPRDKEGAEP